jgi:hypothetical protein
MRIASFIAAGVLGLLSLGLLAGGGLMLWGDAEKDEHGYLSTESERFATNTYALATENLDIDGIDWILGRERWGKIRLEAAAGDDRRLFIGIARTNDVADYLRGTNHDLVTDIDYAPFRADYRELDGDAKPARPADQSLWAASAHGAGTQALTWEVEDGDWSVVVMNDNAARGVDADVKAGAELPFLSGAGWGSLAAGFGALGIAAGLAVLGVRGPRRRTAVAA